MFVYNGIVDKFNSAFILNESIKSVVIYGTADCAKTIVSNIDSEKIVGLMDQQKTGEIIYGHKVLSYDEVALLDNPTIVIAARTSVIKIVYRRIRDFCIEHNIDVYDVNGNLLHDDKVAFVERDCFNLDERELLNAIEEAEVVSFDVFDTLLCRTVLRPRDIYQFIDAKTKQSGILFSQERIRAEEELNLVCAPTIHQIYERIMINTGIDKEEANRLFELEISTEKLFLKKRTYMCELLKKIVCQNKKVILVSDMYFDKKILKDIVGSFGIEKYDELYISCEYGCNKEHGLFQKVLADLKVEASRVLHIGDNLNADYLAAKSMGLNAYRIFSVSEMLESSGYSTLLDNTLSFEENCIVARFALDVYNDPFGGYDKCGKIAFNNDEEMVKAIIAPIVFKYSLWIAQRTKEMNVSQVLFPSRDGYIVKKLYMILNKYVNLPACKYIYVSRRATMTAAADTIERVDNILDFPDDRKFRDMIKARFGIDLGDVGSKEDLDKDMYQALLERCEIERHNYHKYLEREQITVDDKVLFTDLVAMGRIQESLQKILNTEIRGAYFVKRISDGRGTENLNVKSMYPIEDDYSAKSKVYQYYYLLECIMTSYEPSLYGFGDNGNPVFYKESRTKDYIDNLKKCHNAILEYSEEMYKCCSNPLEWIADIAIYDNILGFLSQDYSDINSSLLLCGINTDEFMGKEVINFNR